MAAIEGGNIINGGTVMGQTKPRIVHVATTFASGAGSDGKVGGGYYTPAVGDLVDSMDSGNLWERTGVNTYVRRDTL